MKRVLITGADSYVGTSVEQYLSLQPAHYYVHTVDVRDITWKNADFSGYDCVFHVAGIAHADIRKLSEDERALYFKVNTQLAVEVARKAKEQGVRQFLFMSTANVYGLSAPIGKRKVVTRETPTVRVNCYSDSKLKAEEEILQLASEEFRVVILRCPMIYGRNCKGNYVTLSKMARKLPVFPKVDNARSMLYIGNLTEFVRLMIENEEQGIFCPSDKEVFCTSDLVKLIGEANGKKVRLIPGCGWMLKLLSHVSGMVNKAFGNFAYADELSACKQEYRKYTLEEAIKETERK